MARTAEAVRLNEAHRAAQVRLGQQTVAQLLEVWPLLDVNALDSTAARWLAAAVPIVETQRGASVRLAADYITAHRLLEIGEDITAVLGTWPAREQIATSLLVTGPYRLKSAAGRGLPLRPAISRAQATSSAAGMRHALNGGREVVLATAREDPRSAGWSRITSGKPCPFCEMLAGRGAVYSASTVTFQAHDGCSCSAAPEYR